MHTLVDQLNGWGALSLKFAWAMLWQSSLLIGLMLGLEWALRRRVRAAVRYALWLVVLAKLLLPPSLAVPTGLGWWLHLAAAPTAAPRTSSVAFAYGPAAQGSNLHDSIAENEMTSEQPSVSTAGVVLLISSVVSFALLAWMVVRWRQTMRLARQSPEPPLWLEELLETTRQAAGWHRPIRLCLVDATVSPAVCGLIRPVLLFPQALVGQLSPEQLRAVFLHELIHLRRGDIWVNCAQALLQVIYWWHPLLWLANARLRRVREEAVDDAVMVALREQADTYAPTLLEVAKLALQRPLVSLGLVGILESHSFLRERIERLLDFRPPRQVGLTLAAILCAVAFGAVALPMGAGPNKTNAVSVAAAVNSARQELTPLPAITQQPTSATTGLSKNSTAPELNSSLPQLNIKAKFIEISEDATATIWGKLGYKAGDTNLATTLTSTEVATVMKAIESSPGVDLLNLADVTTLSDRQVEVQVVDIVPIATNINPQALKPPGVSTTTNGSADLYLNATVPFGPTLGLNPHVGSDGWTIHLTAVPQVMEFVGYAPPTNSLTVYVNGKKTTASTPRPRINLRQITNSAVLWDGQTLVLRGPVAEKITKVKSKVPVLGDIPLVGRLFRSSSTLSEKKHLLVLITPTLIDATGKRVHTDEEVLLAASKPGGTRKASPVQQ
ncbi:MAG TPA: M56 family metallopeptidase [Clostridia bacterium]|nr:M56 family metallopeptidase [Clostridia bacterium]